MKSFISSLFFLLVVILPSINYAELHVGIGKTNITPPPGAPSAGYRDRKGEGMQGIHDPLFAIALLIDNGEKKIVFCSVDNLGFTYEIVQEIIEKVNRIKQLENCEIYIGSSHTHSGGGAYLNIPVVGESLAGTFSPELTQFYIEKTVEAIIQSSQNLIPSKIGIGYGKAEEITQYRGLWPIGITPLSNVAVIKMTRLDDTPLAVLFNYPIHPTVLRSQNRLFSADFVGYAREHLQSLLGSNVEALYFNGAQGDIVPIEFNMKNDFEACAYIGHSLANTVEKLWNEIDAVDSLDIKTQKESYTFKPQATPFGVTIPLDIYKSEMNLIVLNNLHAFITVPGELSTIYDYQLKEIGKQFGYTQVSIFGLTNDAHGYIITPESWRHKTFESRLSFGGENYGEETKSRAADLLKRGQIILYVKSR